MADQKVSDLPSLNGADVDAADLLYIIDSSAGTAGSKKITVGQYQVAPYSAGTTNGVMYLNGSNVVTTGAGLTFDGTNFATIGTASATKLIPTGGSATGNGMYLPAANTLAWSNNGAETMRLDSSGNLGLGVTPSAWSSSAKAIQINTRAALFGFSDDTHVGQNVYYDGVGPKYIATGGAASNYRQTTGQHAWFTAPSGTAGNAITFTQAMTLDSSGNLGVGTTSPTQRLTVQSGTSASPGVNILGSGASQGWLRLGNNADIKGGDDYLGMTFTVGASERARIDSSGNFLVGTTTVGSALTEGFSLQQGGGASQIHIGHTSGIGSGELYAGFSRGGTTIGSISQNGTTAVLYNTTSDRRLKDNIVPAPIASDDIDAIQIVSYEWKSAPDEQVKYGVIAQDLHAVAPQAVLQGDDGDEIEKTWGVDYSKLVPMLIKEIQTLRARVAALEAQ